MGQVDFIDIAIPEMYEKWLHSWKKWPQREVAAHPDYVRLFAREGDHVRCAVMPTESGGCILYPFIQRPLANELWAADENVWDITTPYGYGGPFVWSYIDKEADIFWSEFEAWAAEEGIVSSFARLSLFPGQIIPFNGTIEVDRPNIVRSLDVTQDELWYDYDHKVRKNVKKAKRSGLSVKVDLMGKHLEDFFKIYYSTMDRRNASAMYYFPRNFFHSIVKNLSGQFAFFYTLHEGKVVSTELILISVEYLYSFLGGTLSEAFSMRPNDLLKHEIIDWGRQLGKKAFILGGGVAGRDGIFRYKQSFAPTGEISFMVAKKVHNSQVFKRITKRRSKWESAQGNDWHPRPGFFPDYRS